ncbi:MAG: transporter substrate-binding domain-containing protein [Spirochaetales bacterium]|nr:transporter substrate-binding domain-containing protein [Spirochaetales bacterium]
MGNEETYPKIGYREGEVAGVLCEILEYADERMAETFRVELYPWSRAYSYALTENVGIVGISQTAERSDIFDFSMTLFHDEVILVVKKGEEFDFNSYADLQGKVVGVCRNCSFGPAYEEAKNTFSIVPDGGIEQRLRLLLASRTDVAIVNPGREGLSHELEKISDLYPEQFTVLETPMEIDPNYLAFSKSQDREEFLDRFNRVIKEGVENGDIRKIIEEYCDLPSQSPVP